MNNQNPRPDPDKKPEVTVGYPQDAMYYQSDGSGVFLVDGVLFKVRQAKFVGKASYLINVNCPTQPSYREMVQATSIFGSQTGAAVDSKKKFTPLYIEDILPKLSDSSSAFPINVPGVTKKQFRTYLLLITGLPYNEAYLSVLVDYLTPEKHTLSLFLQYLDIATVAGRFGMIKLEEWAMNALRVVFIESASSFRDVSHDWKYDNLLQLRELTRATDLDLPVQAFIQYLIHKIVLDIQQAQDGQSSKTADLLAIYQGSKHTDDDDELLGCVFLNLLSLGHRSQVWSDLARDDKAVLYAAQAQLTDLPREFEPESLTWVGNPDPELVQQLCGSCQSKLSGIWDKTFGGRSGELGSDIPLKDVRFLAEMPKCRWTLWDEMSRVAPATCTLSTLVPPSSPAAAGEPQLIACSFRPLLNDVDKHIRDIYQQVASRYRNIAKEF